MLKKIDIRLLACLGLILLLAMLAGCTRQTTEEAEPVAEAVAEETAPVEVDMEAVTAKLATFDEKDGEADNVVKKCAGCALMMDGLEEHRLDVAGYQLHFCGADCKTHFEAGPEEAIMALVIEEPES